MRAKAVSIANPRTEAQQSQRLKFSIASRFLQPCRDFLRAGYKNYAIKKSAHNAAMSYTITNAITGTYPALNIDYPKVMLSRGALTTAANAHADFTGGVVDITWDDNATLGSAKPTDKALAIVVNPDNGEAVYKIAGAKRSSCAEQLNIPMDWIGDEVEVYLGFISEDGKEVLNSVYVGSVTVS